MPGPGNVKHPAPRASAEEIAAARARSAGVIGSVKSWVYQLAGLGVTRAAASPYDLLVVYATTGVGDGGALQPSDFALLKRTSDDRRRLVVSHLSIGEAEDYRPDYFGAEYLEEDAPDWLMRENPQWIGNRIISFCD